MERTVAAAKVAVKVEEREGLEDGGVVWSFGGFAWMVGVPVSAVELEKRAEGEKMVAIGGDLI